MPISDLTNEIKKEKETRVITNNQHLNRIRSIENQLGIISNSQETENMINEENLNNAIKKIKTINLKNFFK